MYNGRAKIKKAWVINCKGSHVDDLAMAIKMTFCSSIHRWDFRADFKRREVGDGEFYRTAQERERRCIPPY
jgi:hypothetical protein